MKKKILILTLTLSALSLFTIESYGQERPLMTREEHQRLDSLEAIHKKEQVQTQEAKDATNITSLRNSRRLTKAKAKEARRVESEANAAAKQSRDAYRTEKRAQKARKQADRQAQKAAEARNKSDKN